MVEGLLLVVLVVVAVVDLEIANTLLYVIKGHKVFVCSNAQKYL